MRLRHLFFGLGLAVGLATLPIGSASAERATARAPRAVAAQPALPTASERATPPSATPTRKQLRRPDLVLQIAKPAHPDADMNFQFANFGEAPAYGFKIHVKLEYACEIGKLIHLADQKTFHLTGLDVGGVQSGKWKPSSGFNSGGCYSRVRMEIDSTGIVFEKNENNNVAYGHWCFSGSCY